MSYAAQLRKYGIELSEAGARCAELMGEFYHGLHHFPTGDSGLRKLNWKGQFIEYTTHEIFSSFDSSGLTRLVLLAHKHCIRVEIQPAMRYLRVALYPRKRESTCVMSRHPDLDELSRNIEKAR